MLIEDYTDTEITDEKFTELVNENDSIVVFHFFAEWCMNCLMLTPVIEDLAIQLDKVTFVKINIEDNRDLANKYGVSKIPCIIVFKDGQEVNRLKGNQTIEIIEETIKGHL